ncbi:MAG: radical SAM family heme chaperone HemW [Deltaproteobacteria bacterium]|nr:radical SAM family heme chaperone HemW [Deltaproteobacteria bacterium]
MSKNEINDKKIKQLSIYIHIPFCKSKCNYCSFYSIPLSKEGNIFNDLKNLKNNGKARKAYGNNKRLEYNLNGNNPRNYSEMLKSELEAMSDRFNLGGSFISSVYFGGGTPGIMPAGFFKNVLEFINENFLIAGDAEITVEINPESGNFEKLSALKSLGVNRLSIGAQSFNDDVLKTAGRIHNKKDIFNVVNNAKRIGFKNISLDLIIGLPGQTETIFYNDIRQTLDMEPGHISGYMLSVEKNTKFYKTCNEKNEKNRLTFISEENTAKYYEILCKLLVENGYIHYEISNFAKNRHESRHNLNYWKRGEYLGLGPSASSFLKTEDGKEIRKTNVADFDKYAGNILQKTGNEYEADLLEILTEKDKINEEIFLSLRTNSGINAKRLTEWVSPVIISSFIGEGLMQIKRNENIVLTLKGILLSSEIFARIIV